MRSKTFLEFVLDHYEGKQFYGHSHDCPFCSSSSGFQIRRCKPGQRQRYKCHACGEWGDVFDLVKAFEPSLNFAQREARVEELRDRFELKHGVSPTPLGDGGEPSFHRKHQATLHRALNRIANILADDETSPTFALSVLADVSRVCREAGISMEVLVGYWQAWEEVTTRVLTKHDPGLCDDDHCANPICCGVNGRSAPSREELHAYLEQNDIPISPFYR